MFCDRKFWNQKCAKLHIWALIQYKNTVLLSVLLIHIQYLLKFDVSYFNFLLYFWRVFSLNYAKTTHGILLFPNLSAVAVSFSLYIFSHKSVLDQLDSKRSSIVIFCLKKSQDFKSLKKQRICLKFGFNDGQQIKLQKS